MGNNQVQQLRNKKLLKQYLNIKNIKPMNRFPVGSPRSSTFNNVAADVQYELTRHFMNYAKDQLVNKQLQIMMESNLLLESLSKNMNRQACNYQKQHCSFIATSNTMDSFLTEQQELPTRGRKVFQRKNNSFVQPRVNKSTSTSQGLEIQLQEIRKKCSKKTVQGIQKLLQNYLKLKKKASQKNKQKQLLVGISLKTQNDCSEKNQHQVEDRNIQRLKQKADKLQKNNIELTNRIKQLQNKVWEQDIAITNEKKKLIEKQQQIFKLNLKVKQLRFAYTNILDEVKDKVKQYYDQEQQRIIPYSNKIQEIHTSIMKALQENFVVQGCNKCCVLIKKLKQSLINYKNCLNSEIEHYKRLEQRMHLNPQNWQHSPSKNINNAQILINLKTDGAKQRSLSNMIQ